MTPFVHKKLFGSIEMKLETLCLVGSLSVCLMAAASGAPIIGAAVGASLLIGARVRNNARACLTTNQDTTGCQYINNCEYPVRVSNGKRIKILEQNGEASCFKDKKGYIQSSRRVLTVRKNPQASDCLAFKKNLSDNTVVRNRCNRPVHFEIQAPEAPPCSSSLTKHTSSTCPIPFKDFSSDTVHAEFEPPSTTKPPISTAHLTEPATEPAIKTRSCDERNTMRAEVAVQLQEGLACQQTGGKDCQEKLQKTIKFAQEMTDLDKTCGGKMKGIKVAFSDGTKNPPLEVDGDFGAGWGRNRNRNRNNKNQ